MAPPRQPQLMDELIEEILLLFPSDDPASLVRAALVCRTWRRIVSDPRFSRRFRELHTTPTMFGVFVNFVAGDGADASGFVPTAASCPSLPDRRAFRTLDARHGRVLLHNKHAPQEFLVVWDPIADEQQVLPDLQQLYRQSRIWNAAVLCPSATPGRHSSGPFLVVFVCIIGGAAYLCTYSQGATAWSEPLHLDVECGDAVGPNVVGPGILVGDALCFTAGRRVLRYDVAGHALSKIPSTFMNSSNMCLVTVENGELGAVAAAADGRKLSLWWYDGFGGWKKEHMFIGLGITDQFRVLGFAEGADAVFVSAEAGIFAVELKTTRTWKVCEREGRHFCSVVPYRSFYVPDMLLRPSCRGDV